MEVTTQEKINVRDNYNRVRERIAIVARKSGRNPDDIRLVVVTKTKPIDLIRIVIEAGATDIGESYVEEALPKIQAFSASQPLNWHMIGHVQSRKANQVCEYFHYLHSLDSVKLAEKLSQYSQKLNKQLPVWLELNTGGEESKFGWNIVDQQNWKNIIIDLEKIIILPNLLFLGVMTIPPFSTNPEDSRMYYRQVKNFQGYIIKHFHLSGFRELSIGMSSDYEIAIQEGSTCVRIGQAILGPRSG